MLRAFRWLLMGLCIPLIVLALGLTWLRVGINSHPLYHTWVQSQVSQAIGQELYLDAFSLQLRGSHLNIQLADITAAQELSLTHLLLDVDVATSLLQGHLVLSQVQAAGLEINWSQRASGAWGPQPTGDEGRQSTQELMLALVQQVPSLWLHKVSLSLTPIKGPVIRIPTLNARLALDHIAVQSEDGLNHISASLYGIEPNSGVDTADLEAHLKLSISPQQNIKQASIYLHSDGLDLIPWASALKQLIVSENYKAKVNRAYIEGDFWFNYQAGKRIKLMTSKMKLELGSDAVRLALSGKLSAVSSVEVNTQDLFRFNSWRLSASELTGRVNGLDIPIETLIAQNLQGQFAIAVPQLNLDNTLALLQTIEGLPPKIVTPIHALAPSGNATNVRLHVDLKHPKEFLFQAELQGASVNPWLGVPQIEQADGHIWLNRYGGKVAIADDNGLSVRVVKLISNAWAMEGLQGEFSWRYGALSNHFESSNIAIELAQGQANLAIAAEFPRKGSAIRPMLQLALGFQNLDLAGLPKLLPDRVLGDQLGAWLTQSTPQGQVDEAALIYLGQPGVSKVIPIKAKVTSPSLIYANDWPAVENLEATVAVNATTVRVAAQSGRIVTPQLSQLIDGWQVQVPIKAGAGQYIDIQGQVAGEAEHIMSLVQQLPIRLSLPAWLHDTRPQGLVKVMGDVAVAYGHKAPASYDLEASSEDLSATWLPLQADFRHIEFSAAISSATNGIGAVSGSGLMDGQNISFKRLDQLALTGPWLDQIPTTIVDSQRFAQRDLVIEFSGRAQAGYLHTKYQQPWLQQIPGELPFVVRLATCTDAKVDACSQLSAQIDLSRAGFNLPAPIDQLQQIQLLGDWHGIQQQWYAAIDNHHLSIALQQGTATDSRLQWQGAALSFQQPGNWAQPGEWSVSGQLDDIDMAAWWQAYKTHIAPLVDARTRMQPQIKVQIKHAQWHDMLLDDVMVDFQSLTESADTEIAPPWRLHLASKQLAGQIDFLSAQNPLAVQVDYAHFDFPEAETDVNSDLLEHIDPSTIPDADVTIDNLVKNGESFGQWQFKTRRQNSQVNVHDLEALIRHSHLQGNLIWSKVEGLHQTQFTGRVATSDISNMLIDWGYGPSVSANTSAIEAQLEWPHSPLAFALKEVTGDIGLRLKQGRFAESLDGATGLKVLSLMDMRRLMRRIKLDFSDVIKPGFDFDSVNAHYRFNQGVAQTVSPLALKSSSLNLTMNGWIDFNQRLVDNNLVVTLPVADKLPLAALLAGLPQLSGAIYIANKLIGDELETFTSARYQVVGSLDEPQVELVKIFDKDYQNQTIPERIENVISIN